MALEAAVADETRRWLAKAERDLYAARTGMGADPPLLDDAAFHCQQAVEKVLKAFLVGHGQSFRKTHLLVEIGMQCVEVDSSLLLLVERVRPLTDYAWRFRYPGETEIPTEEEAKRALTIAEEVVAAVRDRLPLPTSDSSAS